MTNQASIQTQVWKGYLKGAEKLGANYQFFRPTATGGNLQLEGGAGDLELEGGAGNILLQSDYWTYPGTTLFTRSVSLNAEDMKYGKPNKYGKPTWYALADGNGLQHGDYFVGPQGTFFVAAVQPLLPILVVECNRAISIYRPKPQSGVGLQDYGGTTNDNLQTLVRNVPCSILQGTKGEKSETNLPADTRAPWWTILIPSSVCDVLPDDILVDDRGIRYVVSSPELSDLGFRLQCMTAIT